MLIPVEPVIYANPEVLNMIRFLNKSAIKVASSEIVWDIARIFLFNLVVLKVFFQVKI